MRDLVLGIDTGGTYTDGVLLDYHTREVVSTTKTLTTRHDLTVCILNALDALLPEDPSWIKLVSISTTLATNAIAEGKGRPTALFLLGYDQELVTRFNLDGRFATSRYYYFRGGHDLTGKEQAPLDIDSLLDTARSLSNEVEAVAVSGYFSPFNNTHEEKAYEAITTQTDLPVVLGHQLSSRINSVQRATTATLNASLLSILQDFITAMRRALDDRGVTAPLMVMRGDGALMNADSINRRPVETVHSGPAASAIGARFLAEQDQALVVDIGGTTTDIAVLDRGRVAIREEGTTVGEYRTAVRAANIRSIGLGGDSLISLDVEDRLVIGPERVVPLSYLAHTDAYVAEDIKHIDHRFSRRPNRYHIEYWFLQREPRRSIKNPRARAALDMLREHPVALPKLLDRMGLFHPLQFDGQSLIKEEIIGRASLTPTDLFHLTGEFDRWDVTAAHSAAYVISRLLGVTIDELIEQMKAYVAEHIAEEIVAFISGHPINRTPGYTPTGDLGTWFFEESLYQTHPYLRSEIALRIPLIGIGAPAGIFLPQVAELLKTDLILPEHFEVANAIGAVAGGVMISHEAWIFPQVRGRNVIGFFVQAGRERKRFSTIEDAMAYARQAIGDMVLEQARQAGAINPVLELEETPDGADSYRIRGTAIGNPKMSEKVESSHSES